MGTDFESVPNIIYKVLFPDLNMLNTIKKCLPLFKLRISSFITLSVVAGMISIFPFNAALCFQDENAAIRESEKAIGRRIGDYTLIDQDGKNFRLKEMPGKPLVISFIYTSCGHICPTITMNLRKAIKEAGKDFGEKFNAITIGFDVEHDTSQRMKEYGGNFTDDFKNWRFATSDRETIERLAKDIGFYYKKTDEGFDHLNLVTIVDKNWKIYKQVYGMDFKPQEILQPIYQSLSPQGAPAPEPSGIIGKLFLFCYKYDPATGTYKLDYAMLMTLAMGPIFFFITVLLIAYLFFGDKIKRIVFKKSPQPR